MAYGPELKSLVLENTEIDLEKNDTLTLTDLTIKALFDNTEVEIPNNNASNWTLDSGIGSYNTTTGVYTAPDSEGIANLKFSFEHKNKYWDKKDTAEITLTLNIGQLPENILLIANSYTTSYRPEQVISDSANNLYITHSEDSEINGVFKYDTNLNNEYSFNPDNYLKIGLSNDEQHIITNERKSDKAPGYEYLYNYQEITKYSASNGNKVDSLVIAFGEVDVDPRHPDEGKVYPTDYDINLDDREKWDIMPREFVEDTDGNLYVYNYVGRYDSNSGETYYESNILKIDWNLKAFASSDELNHSSSGSICYANGVIYIATNDKLYIYNTSLAKVEEYSLPVTNYITFDIKLSSDGTKAYLFSINTDGSYYVLVYDITANSIAFDKELTIPNADSLENPIGGIALTDDYLFILDTNAKKVYKYTLVSKKI